MRTVEMLASQLDEVYGRLLQRIEGLTDEEYLWEPAEHCWTIHHVDGVGWVADYAEPDPDPAPVTTIGWRLVHIADCKLMYHEWAFGPRRLTFPDLVPPHTVDGAVARIAEGQALLRADLAGFAEGELDAPRLTNWGEEWPAWRIFWTMIDHDAHHGAEIGCLRDLFRSRPGHGGGAPADS